MPDACRTSVCIKSAILCPSIATRAIKIHASFHQAIFEIKHTVYQVPWAYRVTRIGTKSAIDGFQSCSSEGSQSHLVTTVGDHLLMAYSIGCANDRMRLLMIEAIIVCDGQVFQSNIVTIEIECSNS